MSSFILFGVLFGSIACSAPDQSRIELKPPGPEAQAAASEMAAPAPSTAQTNTPHRVATRRVVASLRYPAPAQIQSSTCAKQLEAVGGGKENSILEYWAQVAAGVRQLSDAARRRRAQCCVQSKGALQKGNTQRKQRDQAKPLEGLGCWLMREMEREKIGALLVWGVAFRVRRRKGVIAHSQPG